MATVLVCDDQPALRELVRAALAEGDYEIVEARTGAESLRLAKEFHPDVVVLDMVLPDRSGLDVLTELRRDPALVLTRVILCSAGISSVDSRVVASLEVDRYLPKPFSPLELASLVDNLVTGSR